MGSLNKLHQEVLPPNTLNLFKEFHAYAGLIQELRLDQQLCLVGGTALALQIGHRKSNDLDLACFDKKLPNNAIDQFLFELKKTHQVRELNSVAQISQFKIQTGLNLLDYVRDFNINQVKVTFLTLGESAKQQVFYKAAPKINQSWVFPLLGTDGLEVAKTLVMKNRVRSRDLYDLMILMRDHGYTLNSLINNLQTYLLNDDLEYYRAVLTGRIPLDRDDEGLLPVNVDVTIDQIYQFFKQQFKFYDLDLATKLLNQQ